MPRWGRRRRYKSKSKHQQHCLVMHTIFFTNKQLFSLFMRRYEEEELYFVIAEKRLFNNVYVLDAITTITFHKLKTGHTISNSRSSETKSILHFLAPSWIFVLPTLYSNVKKIKVVAVDKKKEFRPFSELVCTNEFFCRRNSWNYFCMKQQTWYFCSNGNKIVDEEQKTYTTRASNK